MWSAIGVIGTTVAGAGAIWTSTAAAGGGDTAGTDKAGSDSTDRGGTETGTEPGGVNGANCRNGGAAMEAPT